MTLARILSTTALILGLIIICRKGHTQDFNALDTYMERMASMRKYTGTLMLASDDKILYERAFGPANAQGSSMNSTKSAYAIGSVTKTFTAVLLLQMVEEGKLQLGDTLAAWHPEIPYAKDITIRQLLNHTSGIASYTDMPNLNEWQYTSQSRADMLKKISSLEPRFVPGESQAYSNSNYYLLGAILERTSGKNYESLLQERILRPLSMNNSGSQTPSIKSSLSEGLNPTNKAWESAAPMEPSIPFAAGAMHSTVLDMHSFSVALFTGKLFKEAATLDTMRSPTTGTYAMGLFESEVAGERGVGHTGGIDGYSAMWMYFPGKKLHFISLSNSMLSDHQAVAEQTMRVYRGEPIEMPEQRQSVILPTELLQRYAGAYALDAGFLLNVAVAAEGLSIEVPGQPAVTVAAADERLFYSEVLNLELGFELEEDGSKVKSITLRQAGMDFKGSPFNMPDQLITIPADKLKRLEGTYELAKGFDIKIFVQGEILMAQATGQGAFELMAEDETHFFATVAPIDIQFEFDDEGATKALLLKQGGTVTYAEKKE